MFTRTTPNWPATASVATIPIRAACPRPCRSAPAARVTSSPNPITARTAALLARLPRAACIQARRSATSATCAGCHRGAVQQVSLNKGHQACTGCQPRIAAPARACPGWLQHLPPARGRASSRPATRVARVVTKRIPERKRRPVVVAIPASNKPQRRAIKLAPIVTSRTSVTDQKSCPTATARSSRARTDSSAPVA